MPLWEKYISVIRSQEKYNNAIERTPDHLNCFIGTTSRTVKTLTDGTATKKFLPVTDMNADGSKLMNSDFITKYDEPNPKMSRRRRPSTALSGNP